MINRLLKSVLSVFLVALIAVMALTGCAANQNGNPDPQGTIVTNQTHSPNSGATAIGEGNTNFAFEVTDNKGVVTKFTVNTNEKTVGAALLKLGLIEGEDSANGLYVKAVNGLAADYNADKAYWAFYVNGEYATSGVDSTSIEAGTTYAFVYTKG